MFFNKEEKVFSLSGTSGIVLRDDLKSLWSEFYCYLLLAGFYSEGEDDQSQSVSPVVSNISGDGFCLSMGNYNIKLGELISRGLSDRFKAILVHKDTNESEKALLADLDGLFSFDNPSYLDLNATKLYSVAVTRQLSETMTTIAHYVSVMYGRKSFCPDVTLPRLYLSVFGNIHLSLEDKVSLSAPQLIYKSRLEDGTQVTPLWSFLSAQIDSLVKFPNPGDVLGDMLSTYSFLEGSTDFFKSVCIPRFASGLYIASFSGGRLPKPKMASAWFYTNFFFGQSGDLRIIRSSCFHALLDCMRKKIGKDNSYCLFRELSFYEPLRTTRKIYGKTPTPSPLDYALEVLDADPEPEPSKDKEDPDSEESEEDDDKDKKSDTKEAPEPSETPDAPDNQAPPLPNDPDADGEAPPLQPDPVTDPDDEDNAYDPSNPPPAVPATAPLMDKDTIDLISFDKTGEGINEDLYRSTVVVLNDRLKSDDSVPVKAEVKEALDYWVNGFLYRTAISATKDQIAYLGLQKYLKKVSQKG